MMTREEIAAIDRECEERHQFNRSIQEVQRQTAEVPGSGKLPDGGDTHVLRFCDAHPGEHDRGSKTRSDDFRLRTLLPENWQPVTAK